MQSSAFSHEETETASLPATPEDSITHFAHSLSRMANLMDRICDQQERLLQAGAGGVAEAAPAEDSSRAAYGKPKTSFVGVHGLDVGPLHELLQDQSINDILINNSGEIYVERGGHMVKTDVTFPDEASLLHFAHTIAHSVGRRLDPKRPLLDARLPDGSRVNIIAPPLSVDGISMSIRKFAKDTITLEKMVASGCLSEQLSAFLKVAAKAKINIVISGGTGSGKTTLLNAVSQHIQPTDRIVTIEDSAELQLQLPHVVRLETKEPEVRGDSRDEVTMRDLVKNSLRMRPERIIVGEVRGPEAFDMIQAMNTGHDGSLTTIHANTPRDGLARIENMVSMANLNVPAASIRKQIASAIHLFVQTGRMEDGVRRVQVISEVVGMEADIITMQDLFKFTPQGMGPDGKLKGTQKWTSVFPRHSGFSQMLRDAGILTLGAQ